MARKRDLAPQLWKSEQVGTVSRDARLLFIGCISSADDEGRLKASPRYLKAEIFPYDDELRADDVRAWRDELLAENLVCVYEVQGQEFLHLPTWSKWQRVSHAYASQLPPCPEHHPTAVALERSRSFWNDPEGSRTFEPSGVVVEAGPGPVPDPVSVPVAGAVEEAFDSPTPSEPESDGSPPSPSPALSDQVMIFDRTLRGVRGYQSSAQLLTKIEQKYARLDLEEEAIKMAGYSSSHTTWMATSTSIFNWLDRSLRKADVSPEKTKGLEEIREYQKQLEEEQRRRWGDDSGSPRKRTYSQRNHV